MDILFIFSGAITKPVTELVLLSYVAVYCKISVCQLLLQTKSLVVFTSHLQFIGLANILMFIVL